MLKTSFVVMTLLGCDCDAKQCEYVSDAPGQWATVGECEAAMQRAVLNNSRLDYPLVTGLCRMIEPQVTTVATPLAPAVDAAETPSVGTSGSSFVFRRTADGYAAVMSGMEQAKAVLVSRSIKTAQSVGPIMSRIGGLLPSF